MKFTSSQIKFLQVVKELTYINPFAPKRNTLSQQITGIDPTQIDVSEYCLRFCTLFEKKFKNFQPLHLDLFGGNDRKLLHTALLYYFFHKYIDRFDQYIIEQTLTSHPNLTLPFGKDLAKELHGVGFTRQEVQRNIAIFFQMRRAFFFIQKALIGESPIMNELKRRIWENVFTHQTPFYDEFLWDKMEDFSTILLGETGTGKGTVAKAIGNSGFIPYDLGSNQFAVHFNEALLTLNLSAFPETLIEPELFGHKKGAFTGAIEDHQGVLARSSKWGSVFLDEIGEVSLTIQVKLLNVIQERVFHPVGSRQKMRFQGRVITATNQDLLEQVRKGQIRSDFYYRLCSDQITVPSLKERIFEDQEELPRLVNHMLTNMLESFSDSIFNFIMERIQKDLPTPYHWPGNVRELEQAIRRVLLTGTYAGFLITTTEEIPKDKTDFIHMTAGQVLHQHCTRVYQQTESISKTAQILKVDRRTVKKYLSLD